MFRSFNNKNYRFPSPDTIVSEQDENGYFLNHLTSSPMHEENIESDNEEMLVDQTIKSDKEETEEEIEEEKEEEKNTHLYNKYIRKYKKFFFSDNGEPIPLEKITDEVFKTRSLNGRYVIPDETFYKRHFKLFNDDKELSLKEIQQIIFNPDNKKMYLNDQLVECTTRVHTRKKQPTTKSKAKKKQTISSAILPKLKSQSDEQTPENLCAPLPEIFPELNTPSNYQLYSGQTFFHADKFNNQTPESDKLTIKPGPK